MATTHFFNNSEGNSLFNKLKAIAQNMSNFDRFLAVVGFFRSSGYFKLRKELEGGDGNDVKEIKILVGINIDDIFRKHNKALLFLSDEEKAKSIYEQDFVDDIKNARYSPEVEEGILTMFQDIADGRLQMRIHTSKNLHAKFYLCLPTNHNESSDGWVIMGSSNISDSGLGLTQPPRYELNVSMKDYDDVNYCHDEFMRLWEEGVPLTINDIDAFKKKTYLGYQPTPYELFIKVLIDAFGDQVEDDFTIQLPDGVKDLKYQKDAVIQGYQMLLEHNGCFLADVVGLGKTMIATMIAKRYIEANGRNTNILVVYPPALEDNWKGTFKLFGIRKHAQFVTNGSLSKILEGKDQYKDKEDYDLIIVDEAHGFRSDSASKYDELQKICKAPCSNPGLLRSIQKRIMLLSATPLNNRPEDLLNQLLLFQNSQTCTIDGVPNLKAFFTPFIMDYKKLMKERENRNVTEDVDKLYDDIRKKVIDKVTVRRTRNNIINDIDYNNDIKEQGITFPSILPPVPLEYKMSAVTSKRFFETLATLSDEENPEHLEYARYRAIEFLKPELRSQFGNAVHIAQTLAGIYRVHMVKRLESSFYAFKKSLATLLRITEDMIKMFDEDKIVIAPELNVKDLMMKDMELDEIIEFAISKGYNKSDFLFKAEDFDPSFKEMLENDIKLLKVLNADWANENEDPKYDEFKAHLTNEFLNKKINPEEKLVLFSESVDTLTYLYGRLTKELKLEDVLMVTAKNRDSMKKCIKENFDANDDTASRKYNIIITSDVLAEGVNLHRANVIINYDSPWNATRLMQRIGRVNRIGSKADNIYNFMFYPSKQGDREIKLYANALVKLQGFHSAFGEDAQIYSKEEIVKQFEMFDSKVKDAVDKKIALLREVRDLYNTNRELYHKIKNLPMKSRVLRDNKHRAGKTIVFVSSNVKTEFYLSDNNTVNIIDFLDAVDYLRAKPEEKPLPFSNDEKHYKNVNSALEKYVRDFVEDADTNTVVRNDLDKVSLEANKFLRTIKQITQDSQLMKSCDALMSFITVGVYQKLPRYIRELSREYKNDRVRMKQDEFLLSNKLDALVAEYNTQNKVKDGDRVTVGDPQIIISESFI
ncbi:MAG: helicase-related protein [Prevotella sp.]|nr:helicase-related protein [Prevotella sp.]